MSALPSGGDNGGNSSPFVPLVNKVNAFHSKTPDRFKSDIRLKSEGENNAGAASSSTNNNSFHPTITQAVSPAFISSMRAERKPVPKSTAELQAEYIAQHAWKANPVNKAVMQSTGDLGVPRIAKKPCTEPVEFHLSSSRAVAPATAEDDAEDVAAFKARQVSKHMLEGPQFATLPSRKQLTETESPMLLTKMRAAMKPAAKGSTADEEECAHQFKAVPAPKNILAKPQVRSLCVFLSSLVFFFFVSG